MKAQLKETMKSFIPQIMEIPVETVESEVEGLITVRQKTKKKQSNP